MTHHYRPEDDLTAIINRMRAEGAFEQNQSNTQGFRAHGYESSSLHPHRVWTSRNVIVEFETPSGARYTNWGTMHEAHTLAE